MTLCPTVDMESRTSKWQNWTYDTKEISKRSFKYAVWFTLAFYSKMQKEREIEENPVKEEASGLHNSESTQPFQIAKDAKNQKWLPKIQQTKNDLLLKFQKGQKVRGFSHREGLVKILRVSGKL